MPTSRDHVCSRLAEVQMILHAIRESAECIRVGGCEAQVCACTELPARANEIILALMREFGADPAQASAWGGPDEGLRPRKRRRGELLAQAEKNKGAKGTGSNQHQVRSRAGTVPPTLADQGIDKKLSSLAQKRRRAPAEPRAAA